MMSENNYEIAKELFAKFKVRDLRRILQAMGSANPYLKQHRVTKSGKLIYLSRSGIAAYDNLVYIIFGLEDLGVLNGANEIVFKLDKILEKECNL